MPDIMMIMNIAANFLGVLDIVNKIGIIGKIIAQMQYIKILLLVLIFLK